MPAKDIYHDVVKRALEKDGWAITQENLRLEWGGTDAYVDLAADKVLVAEKQGRKIAVEVKSFIGKSTLSELEKAIGQFVIYRFALKRKEPERLLYLAIQDKVYYNFFLNPDVLELIEVEQLKIIVFNAEREEIVKWLT